MRPTDARSAAEVAEMRLSESELHFTIRSILTDDEAKAVRLRLTDPPTKYKDIAIAIGMSLASVHCLVRKAGEKVFRHLGIELPPRNDELN